jgi:hypothetical protein
MVVVVVVVVVVLVVVVVVAAGESTAQATHADQPITAHTAS